MITLSPHLFSGFPDYSRFFAEAISQPSLNNTDSREARERGESGVILDVDSVSPLASVIPQSAEVTAAKILSFINKGVATLRGQGEPQTRINERLLSAREGIEKGYADARALLEDLGQLDDMLSSEIDRGKALINDGLVDIEAGRFPKLLSSEQSIDFGSNYTKNYRSASFDESNGLGLVPASDNSVLLAAIEQAQSMELEVVTRDGDKVTVNFLQRESARSGSNRETGARASFYSERYEMKVKGTIDKAELQALQILFDDVYGLTEIFYGSDLGTALGEAMSLGLDGSELASMSLELRQRSFSTVARAYGEVGPLLPTTRLQSQQNMIADYVRHYIDALDRASVLTEPSKTIERITALLVPDDDRLSILQSFHGGLDHLLAP